jgi:hypothetical protein
LQPLSIDVAWHAYLLHGLEEDLLGVPGFIGLVEPLEVHRSQTVEQKWRCVPLIGQLGEDEESLLQLISALLFRSRRSALRHHTHARAQNEAK